MSQPPSFSAALVAADVAAVVVAELDRLGNERGLSDHEQAQLAAFEALQAEARALAPASRSLYAVHASTEAFRQKLQSCADPTKNGIAIVDLLGMRGAVPAEWRRLSVSLNTVLWLGVTRLVDDLSRIGGSDLRTGRRRTQTSIARQLHTALGRVIELSLKDAPTEQIRRATNWADYQFGRATAAIETDLPTIGAEAAALRARRR